MARWGLVKSFNIDDGQLDEFQKHECFVLGYELATIDALLEKKEAFCRSVHAANQDRIRAACITAKKHFRLTWMDGDPSESWMCLEVAGT